MKSRNRCVVVSFVFLCLVVFVIIALIGVVFKGFGKRNHFLTIAEFDPETNKKTLKVVKKELSEDSTTDVRSYTLPSGNFVSISPFGGKEYDCYGSCVCPDDASERRTSLALMRTLYFAATATSVGMAIKISKNFFSDYCERQYSSMCAKVRPDWNLEAEYDKIKIEGCKESDRDLPHIPYGYDTWKCSGKCRDSEKEFENNDPEWIDGAIDVMKELAFLRGILEKEAGPINCAEDTYYGSVKLPDWRKKEYAEDEYSDQLVDDCIDKGYVGPEANILSVCYPDYDSIQCVKEVKGDK